MNIYHIWCDLKPGVRDTDFTDAVTDWLASMEEDGSLAGWRITRRKLGLGLQGLGDFHLMLEFDSLAQLDDAFMLVSTRSDPVESLHHAVNSLVTDVKFALYRDFPDAQRCYGEEMF